MKLKDNTIYQYQGGGYEGCFWEWNMGMSLGGKFYSLYASGRHGAKTLEELENRLETLQKESEWGVRKNVFLTDLTSDADKTELARECNQSLLLDCLPKANAIMDEEDAPEDLRVFFICDTCGEKILPEDPDFPNVLPTSYKGLKNGIGTELTGIVCEDCYSRGQCPQCDCYVGVDNLTYWNEEDYCESCLGKAHNEISDNYGMVELVLGLDFTTVKEYYEYILESNLNGNQQEGELFTDMPEDNQVEFLEWLLDGCFTEKLALHRKLIKLVV